METDAQEPQTPAHRHELQGEHTFAYHGHECNQQNSVKILKDLFLETNILR